MKKTTSLSDLSDQKQRHRENSYVGHRQSHHESGVVVRAFLVIALSLTLVGVLRWALNVTNANARQISRDLTRLQGRYDSQEQSMRPHNTDSASIRPSSNPVIEPDTR